MQQRQSFTKYANWPDSTLFTKMSSNPPEIENLPLIHLPIYKKIFVSGSKSKIFNNEAWFCYCQAQIFNLLVKILESDSETKIFLYIGK